MTYLLDEDGGESMRKSALHGHAGEGQDHKAAHWLTKEAGWLEDAEQQLILNLRTGMCIIRTGDNRVIINAPAAVHIRLNDYWIIAIANRRRSRCQVRIQKMRA